MVWGLGSYGLYEPHEGHFAGVGREMLRTGDWITPHLNGSPYLNKPPLLYWSVALSNALLGINEWGSRLPGALFGWMGVVVAWAWAGRLWGRVAARLAAPMATISVGWFMFTHQLMTDATLSALSFASLYMLWRCVTDPLNKKGWLIFYLVCSLALMTKGPGAVFAPLVGVSFILWRKRWELFKQSGWWWGVPLALAPLAVWSLWVNYRNPGFLHHIFVNEVWNRIFDKRWPPDYKVSKVSALDYVVITAIWCAPWTLLLPFSGWFSWKQIGQPSPPETQQESVQADVYIHGVQRGQRALDSSSAHSDGLLILLLGAVWPVLLFLPIPSRLVYYCLPTVLPVAVLTAAWWAKLGSSETKNAERLIPGVLFGVLGLVTLSAGFWVTPLVKDFPELKAAPTTLEQIPLMAFMLGGALTTGGLLLMVGRTRWAAAAVCVLMGLANMKAADGLVAFQDIRSSKRMVSELDPLLKKDALWVSEGSFELGASAGIAYYLGNDGEGKPRFVRVMTDDVRRIQPKFGNLPRTYETNMKQLQELWDSPRPVVFVTDMMRKDFESKDKQPNLPAGHGNPWKERYGFRRVYGNKAAWARLNKTEKAASK